jgi:uncharacterized membrane protein
VEQRLETEFKVASAGKTWEIVPMNGLVGVILGILFLYFFFRHFIFCLMFFDLILSWLRRFRWFPGEGKRMRVFVHWLISVTLFVGFLVVAGGAGWLQFVPK